MVKVKKSKGKRAKEAKKLVKQQQKRAISEKVWHKIAIAHWIVPFHILHILFHIFQLSRPPTIKKIIKKHKFDPLKLKRGIVLVKNLPHGFFEEQLQAYFSQYGVVTRLRLARSERTGNSKSYAFIEFKYPEVAQVAAESMNNYLMFRHLIKTVYIPPEEQRIDYFKQRVRFVKRADGTTELRTPVIERREQHLRKVNKNMSEKRHTELTQRSEWQ